MMNTPPRLKDMDKKDKLTSGETGLEPALWSWY